MIKLLQQIHLETELKSIPIDILKGYISDLVEEIILDYGKTVDKDQAGHIVTRTYQFAVSPRYRSWQLGELISAIEKGKIGTYGGESRASVAMIERWLNGYSSERYKKIVIGQIKQNELDSQMNKSMLGNELGNVILWKLKLPKEERYAYNKLREQGVDVLHEILKCKQNGINPIVLIRKDGDGEEENNNQNAS